MGTAAMGYTSSLHKACPCLVTLITIVAAPGFNQTINHQDTKNTKNDTKIYEDINPIINKLGGILVLLVSWWLDS